MSLHGGGVRRAGAMVLVQNEKQVLDFGRKHWRDAEQRRCPLDSGQQQKQQLRLPESAGPFFCQRCVFQQSGHLPRRFQRLSPFSVRGTPRHAVGPQGPVRTERYARYRCESSRGLLLGLQEALRFRRFLFHAAPDAVEAGSQSARGRQRQGRADAADAVCGKKLEGEKRVLQGQLGAEEPVFLSLFFLALCSESEPKPLFRQQLEAGLRALDPFKFFHVLLRPFHHAFQRFCCDIGAERLASSTSSASGAKTGAAERGQP
mmetsp:Transcript_3270/g.4751  ORF Transcript_3270/g.4751 Transcript_3270/m.4751 type:complete len:261 (+) Transcript_3270:1727-2509(+)